MRDNAHDIAGDGINNGQAVHTILGQHLDGVVQRILRLQVDERTAVLLEHLTPRLQLVLLQLLDLRLMNRTTINKNFAKC